MAALALSWTWRPDVMAVVAVLGATYLLGWCRLHRRQPSAAPAWRLSLYMAGLAVIVLALLSPIDTLGSLLFFMHMAQHELLTMVAPPLLLLGNPLPAILWGLPPAVRRRAARLLGPRAWTRRALQALTLMPVALPLYVVTLWAWHLPAAYEASLRDELVHNVQHLSFFTTALLFWWPIIDPSPKLHGHIHHGFRLLYVFPAAFQSQALGVIFAFFLGRVLYPHYLAVPRLWGFTPLQDQSAAGLLMMPVEGMIYLAVVLLLVARMFAYDERMTRLREERGWEP
jgi:cytochrome c oxidase assembly factor CtaG